MKTSLVEITAEFLNLLNNQGIFMRIKFEEKFQIIREENLFKIFKFFQGIRILDNSVSHDHFKTLKLFLEVIVDPVTFDRLNKRDQLFMENIIFKMSQGVKRDALDLLQKIDVKR